MRNLVELIVIFAAFYLFGDVIVHYFDYDIRNVLPEHDKIKLTILSILIVVIYLMFSNDNKKAGKKK